MNNSSSWKHGMKHQRGVTTLVVVLSLLVIITLLVLASSNIALFEQKTATNENRQKLADQAAEYAVNMSGEFLKTNVSALASKVGNGWLVDAGITKRWIKCSDALPFASTAHPCFGERDNGVNATTSLTLIGGRRAQLYFYRFDGSTALPYASLGGTAPLTAIGGAGGTTFPLTTTVNALLCRLDTTLTKDVSGSAKPAPDCRLDPCIKGINTCLDTSLNRVAVVLTATSGLIANDGTSNENATAVVKETWASYSGAAGAAAVPLIAAGSIEGLGNAEIVAAANGAGIGLPVSMWSACPVDIEKPLGQVYPANCTAPSGSGVGSVSTCQLGEFLKSTLEADLKSTCATSSAACGCPSFNASNSDFLSGHSNTQKRENVDILDKDGYDPAAPVGALPDITFFPDRGMDNPAEPLDDNLFEWIFGQEVVAEGATVVTGCGGTLSLAHTNTCADVVALKDTLSATVVATCAALGPASSGIYYVTGECDLPPQIGTPTESVIVVVDGDAQDPSKGVAVGGNSIFYGMLFIRSRYTMENALNNVHIKGSGGVQFYGSVVVEGAVDITGSIRIVYENASTDAPGKPLPSSTKFSRVPGSWLDSQSTF